MRPELLDKWNQRVSHPSSSPNMKKQTYFQVKNTSRKYFKLIPKLFRRAHFIGKKSN